MRKCWFYTDSFIDSQTDLLMETLNKVCTRLGNGYDVLGRSIMLITI